MAPSVIGTKLALAIAIPQALGLVIGGRLTDLLSRFDPAWYLRISLISTPVGAAFAACAYMAPSGYVFWLMATGNLILSFFGGTTVVVAQNLSPANFRASATAFLLLVVNLVSVGLGPQAVGAASDFLRPWYGNESLRVALLSSTSIAVVSAFFFYRASQTYRKDLAFADAHNKA
jgi:hypothetical protein